MDSEESGRVGGGVRAKLLCVIALLFVGAIGLGFHYKLHKANPSSRYVYHAIPAALSVVYHGWPHDYTANFSIAMLLQGGHGSLQQRMANAAGGRDQFDTTKTYFWMADDRGSLDFLACGFYLFGPTIISMYYFYFLVLGACITIYCMMHRSSTEALRGLAFLLLGFLVCLDIWFLCNSGNVLSGFGEPSINLAENRMYGIFGLFPILSLFFLAQQRAPITVWQLAGGLIQALLFAALVHARSSVMWLVFPLMLAVAAEGFRRSKKSRRSRNGGIVSALIVTALVGKWAFQHETYNPEYFADKGGRTVWHNLVMGLSQNPFYRQTGNIGIDDSLAVSLVSRYELSGELLPSDQHLTAEQENSIKQAVSSAMNSLGGHGSYDWDAYERKARRYFIALALAYPAEFVKTFLWYKPKDTLQTLARLFFAPKGFGAPGRLGFALMFPTGIAIALVVVGAFYRIGGVPIHSERRSLYRFLALCAVFSAAAPLIVYPTFVTVADFAMVVVVLGLAMTYDLTVRYRYPIAADAGNTRSARTMPISRI